MRNISAQPLQLASDAEAGVSPSKVASGVMRALAALQGQPKEARGLRELTGAYVAKRLRNGVHSLQMVRQEMFLLATILREVSELRPDDVECREVVTLLTNLQHQMGVSYDLDRLASKYAAQGERLLAPRSDEE